MQDKGGSGYQFRKAQAEVREWGKAQMKSTGQSQASGPVNAQAQETLERATVSEASYGVRGRATPAHCSTSNQGAG